MPVTFEEYEQEQAKSDQDEEETCERNSEKLNGNVAQYTKGDSQVNLR